MLTAAMIPMFVPREFSCLLEAHSPLQHAWEVLVPLRRWDLMGSTSCETVGMSAIFLVFLSC